MDFISEKKADKKVRVLMLLLCLLPQILRVILSCIYEYEIAGNNKYTALVSDICLYGANILGQLSFFSILGALIYLSARNGIKGGIEVPILFIGLYIALYFIQDTVADTGFTLASFALAATVTAVFIILLARKNKPAHLIMILTLFVPIIGGILEVYAGGIVPSLDDIIYLISYAAANLVFELLFIFAATRISSLLARFLKGEIQVTGKLISFKNPVMLSMLVFDLLYVAISAFKPTVNIVKDLIEYGAPANSSEWLSLIGVYAEYLIIFIIGYASMRVTAGLIEGVYNRAEEE